MNDLKARSLVGCASVSEAFPLLHPPCHSVNQLRVGRPGVREGAWLLACVARSAGGGTFPFGPGIREVGRVFQTRRWGVGSIWERVSSFGVSSSF